MNEANSATSARGINLCDLAPPSRGQPMEMPQTTICGAGIESIRRKIRWNFENVSCGHECRPRASGEHHVLDEHSEIEPASDLKPPVDGHDQADRCANPLPSAVLPVIGPTSRYAVTQSSRVLGSDAKSDEMTRGRGQLFSLVSDRQFQVAKVSSQRRTFSLPTAVCHRGAQHDARGAPWSAIGKAFDRQTFSRPAE